MRAIRIKPGEAPELIDIDNTLKALQHEVDGYIETYGIRNGAVVICNEEGRLKGLAPCAIIEGAEFVGTILIVGVDGDEFTDVPESFLKEVRRGNQNLFYSSRQPRQSGSRRLRLHRKLKGE